MSNRLIPIGIVCMLVVGGFLGIVNLVSEKAKADTWNIETVDNVGDAGGDSSIALGSNGYAHISYLDGTNGNLKYAKWTGSDWNIETVDSAGDVGKDPSIALDSSGYPHISYYGGTNGDLKYAKWTGSDWNIETVDSVGNVGWDTSIALDSSGYPHISYYDGTNGDLKYAKWTGSDWSIETVDSTGNVGQVPSIALDSNDYAHIGYWEGDNDNLKYARWTGSDWSIETIGSASGGGTSIALDTNDYPHISYCNWAGYDFDYGLKYARWTGSAWSIEIVDSDGDGYVSMALDGNSYSHISYRDRFSIDLKYAKWTGSAWINETVDSEGDVGSFSSIALDSSDYPHISYFDDYDDTLNYARIMPNAPSAPRNLQAIAGNSLVTLTWEAPSSDGGAPITNYKIYRGTTSSGKTLLTTVDNVLTYTDTGVVNDNTYYYSVSAVNIGGEGPQSNEVYTTPTATAPALPDAPTNLNVVAGDEQVVLTWHAPSSDGGATITSYRIYRGTSSGGETLFTTVGNVLTYTDTGLTNGQEYFYKVSALNSIGEGPMSNEVNVIPKAGATSEDGEKTGELPWLWIIFLVVIIVVILVVTLALSAKRKEGVSKELPRAAPSLTPTEVESSADIKDISRIIEELQDLRVQGLISEEEFQAKKKRLLERI